MKIKNTNMKRVYFARPISLYGTKQDVRDLELIEKMGFEVLNPNKKQLEERYKAEGMNVFLQCIKECDYIFFRRFQDMKIPAGVMKEINEGIELGLIVLELPTILSYQVLSVEDTREYLKLLGCR